MLFNSRRPKHSVRGQILVDVIVWVGAVAFIVGVLSQVDKWLHPQVQLYQEISEDRQRMIRAIKRPL